MIDLVIIGGGPAGMSAAVAAYDAGVKNILILERESALGGILKQCIHNGFGLHRFSEELTGPEYADRYRRMVEERGIAYKCNTTVLNITPEKQVTATNTTDGIFTVQARAVILAMGCRERPRGALNIPGTRPAGVLSAGTAQKFVNIDGTLPGRDVVILGSGDIGLIMARRMTLEGARVHAVCEIMPYSGGLARNIEQCLNDFDIPLKLSHTVTQIHGEERLCGVTIAKVDENRRPIMGTEEYIPCDTLLLSVGLIPENELTCKLGISLDKNTNGAEVDQYRETAVDGIFACGNVLHVHDLVDFVSEEATIAGTAAAAYLQGIHKDPITVSLIPDGKVRYTVPKRLTARESTKVYFRVADVYRNVRITATCDGQTLGSIKKRRVAPGEMETITLPADILPKQGTIKISLEVEE